MKFNDGVAKKWIGSPATAESLLSLLGLYGRRRRALLAVVRVGDGIAVEPPNKPIKSMHPSLSSSERGKGALLSDLTNSIAEATRPVPS